jgi:hypothetical protein
MGASQPPQGVGGTPEKGVSDSENAERVLSKPTSDLAQVADPLTPAENLAPVTQVGADPTHSEPGPIRGSENPPALNSAENTYSEPKESIVT